ncbi:hypothetical protein CRG98_045223 [Punica granatum]|uniref:Uncharacterized protein n=1 Tax=Punica granatum TaxID=22663 RepID=A0A2I0HSY2_PUNGR|nr:hypothetical protein CRG98_045223 [Punica granatum]
MNSAPGFGRKSSCGKPVGQNVVLTIPVTFRSILVHAFGSIPVYPGSSAFGSIPVSFGSIPVLISNATPIISKQGTSSHGGNGVRAVARRKKGMLLIIFGYIL